MKPDTKVLTPADKRRPPNAGIGRKKGVPNKITRSVKEAFQAAFDTLQKDKEANLQVWGKANPTDFYKISAKLIPTAVEGEINGTLSHEIREIVRKVVDPEK